MPIKFGSGVWLEGPVKCEKKLKGQFDHLADHHMIDDVGAQITSPSGHVPPAIEETRTRVATEMDKTCRYNILKNSI